MVHDPKDLTPAESALLDDLIAALGLAIAREMPELLLVGAHLELEVYRVAAKGDECAASEGATAKRVVDTPPGAPRWAGRPQG